jgi:hypothetical protein
MAFLAIQEVLWGEERIVGTRMVWIERFLFFSGFNFLAQVARASLGG